MNGNVTPKIGLIRCLERINTGETGDGSAYITAASNYYLSPEILFLADDGIACSTESNGNKPYLLLWDLDSGKITKEIEIPTRLIEHDWSLISSRDGRFLAAFGGAMSWEAIIWSTQRWVIQQKLLIKDKYSEMEILDYSSHKPVIYQDEFIRRLYSNALGWALAWSQDTRRALGKRQEGSNIYIEYLDHNGNRINEFLLPFRILNAIDISPDGKLAVVGGDHLRPSYDLWSEWLKQKEYGWIEFEDGNEPHLLYLWDLRIAEMIRTFEGHIQPIICAEFSPDGRKILSAGEDKTIRLWDVGTGDQIAVSQTDDTINKLAFSPRGDSCLAAGHKKISLWRVSQ